MSRFLYAAAVFVLAGVLPATAQTPVEGEITGLETWTASGSPYQVSGDIVIAAGDTLVIQPGVTVEFAAGSDGQATGNNTSLSEINVSGGGWVMAHGTLDSSIIFTSDAGSTAAAGDWYGIYLGLGGGADIEHCEFSYSTYGIYGYTPDTDGISIRTSSFTAMTNAVYLYLHASTVPVVIDSNHVYKTSGSGIYIRYSSDVVITDNVIDSTGSHGIETYGGSVDTTVEITGNILNGENTSNRYGVRLYYSSTPKVTGNTIDNWYYGIYVYNNSTAAAYYLPITGNYITGGSDGLYLADVAGPTLRYNNIYGQAGVAIIHNSQRDIDAKNNYWGETATAEMNTGDNPKSISAITLYGSSSGIVNYGGWLDTLDGTPVCTTITGILELTDAHDAVKKGFAAGDTVFIKVTDPDENGNPAASESLTVQVTSSTEATAEDVLLVETSADAGIFSGMIILEVSGMESADGMLQVQQDDNIAVSYNDAADDYGDGETVTASAVFGMTAVSGDVAGLETWTAAASPYLVTGDVTLGTGDTLVIEPGVTVYFKAGEDDQAAGENLQRCEINIGNGGYLSAQGTETDSIFFTSSADAPAALDWESIYISWSGSATLEYCRLEYAKTGINTYFTNTNTTTIANSAFLNCQRAVDVQLTQSSATTVVTGCYFGAGIMYENIYTQGAQNLEISRCIFSLTDYNYSVQLFNSSTNGSTNVIRENTFSDDGDDIAIYSYSSNPRIIGNSFDGFMWALQSNYSASLKQDILFNTFSNSSIAIANNNDSRPTVRYNNFTGNSSNITNNSGETLDARYNYWGAAATASLENGANPPGFGDDIDYSGWLDRENNGEVVVISDRDNAATEGVPFSYLAMAAGKDETPVISFSGIPHWATASGDSFSGTPDDPHTDTTFLVIATTDSSVDTQSVAIAYTNVNDAPVISGVPDSAEIYANRPFSGAVTVDDEDYDTLIYTLLTAPGGMTVDDTGTVAWDPDNTEAGDTVIVLEVADGEGAADTLTVYLTVMPDYAMESVGSTGSYPFDNCGVTMEVTAVAGSDSMTASVYPDSFPSNLPAGNPVKRFYELSAAAGITSFTVVVTFRYTQEEFNSSDISDESSLYASRWTGVLWEPYPSVVDTVNNTVSCTTSAFSIWSIGGTGGPVPVELSSFTAEAAAGGVQLAWTTASECDNYGFNVLRSAAADGSFEQVNAVLITGAGTTSLPQSYTFTDADTRAGTWYYMLETVGLDGTREYSDAVAVNMQTSVINGIPVFTGRVLLAGQRVFTVQGQSVQNPLNAAAGVYLLQHHDGGFVKILLK